MPAAPLNSLATRALYGFDLSGDLPRIAVPTLVVAGEKDTTPPTGMEEIAALIPGCEPRRIPDTGHMILVEQPEPLAASCCWTRS